MELRRNTYVGIELLRFLRRASQQDPWTAEELAIAINVNDNGITARLAPLYQLDEEKEDNVLIHQTMREILAEKKEQGQSIASISAVRKTLDILRGYHWADGERGRGFWLSQAGRVASLLEVLHACGDDAALTSCTYDRNPFCCPYQGVCRAHKFYGELGSGLAAAFSNVTIEDIAKGNCHIRISVTGRGKRTKTS